MSAPDTPRFPESKQKSIPQKRRNSPNPPLEGVGEEDDEVLLQLVLPHGLDVDHALDVGELELGEEPVEDLDVLADLLGVLGLRGQALLAEEGADLRKGAATNAENQPLG